ncbi:hypothetical protein E2C01_087014 [Portunus trituberculatus]|uniref:Uncharacterized protein n=1 Tax=Portunus trituberculatus TaxID=210409 RepID=A0A5B7JG63_PORTR|nr:hypothetical protein [Portunus trituberculatus]
MGCPYGGMEAYQRDIRVNDASKRLMRNVWLYLFEIEEKKEEEGKDPVRRITMRNGKKRR